VKKLIKIGISEVGGGVKTKKPSGVWGMAYGYFLEQLIVVSQLVFVVQTLVNTLST